MMKQKLKSNNGITLIALIITIIVLLILAVVTIKLMVDNGIVGRATGATNKHTIAEEKEKISLAYANYKMSKIDIDKTQDNLEEQELLERYCLGENKEGVDLDSIASWRLYESNYRFIGNEIIPDASTKLKFTAITDRYNSNGIIISFIYNGKEYLLISDYITQITKKLELANSSVSFEIDGADVIGNAIRGWKVIFHKTGNSYELSPEGIITKGKNTSKELALLERYFLGENGETILYPSIIKDRKFIDNSIIPDASSKIIILDEYMSDFSMEIKEDYQYYYVLFRYENGVYRLKYDSYTQENKEVEFMYAPQGREGQTVKYSYDGKPENEKDWIILYDYGNTVEIISPEELGSLNLGYLDEEAQTPGDVDEDGKLNTKNDKAIYSYNNLIERIHNYTNTLITNPNKISVRAAGSNPDNPLSENTEMYELEYKEFKIGKIKGPDINYKNDFIRIKYFIEKFNSMENSIMPSRAIYHSSPWRVCAYAPFSMNMNIYFFGGYIWGDWETSIDWSFGEIKGKTVLPIVKISSDSIK